MMLRPAVASVVASFCAKAACGAQTNCHLVCGFLMGCRQRILHRCCVRVQDCSVAIKNRTAQLQAAKAGRLQD